MKNSEILKVLILMKNDWEKAILDKIEPDVLKTRSVDQWLFHNVVSKYKNKVIEDDIVSNSIYISLFKNAEKTQKGFRSIKMIYPNDNMNIIEIIQNCYKPNLDLILKTIKNLENENIQQIDR